MKQKGYTLIEIMIVLSIFTAVVVLIAMVSPAIAKRSILNRTTNTLIADINLAKQMASTENCYFAVDFSDDGKSYTIRKQVDIAVFDPEPANLQDEYIWEKVKTIRPLDGKMFFQSGDMTDFAFSSTGLVRLFDISNTEPSRIDLIASTKKKQSPGDIDYSKKIKIYPYGGLSVEQ